MARAYDPQTRRVHDDNLTEHNNKELNKTFMHIKETGLIFLFVV
jgi:hypothetical protein